MSKTIDFSSGKVKNYTVQNVIKHLEKMGWSVIKGKGNHHNLIHPTIKGKLTIPGNPKHTVSPGVLKQVLAKISE